MMRYFHINRTGNNRKDTTFRSKGVRIMKYQVLVLIGASLGLSLLLACNREKPQEPPAFTQAALESPSSAPAAARSMELIGQLRNGEPQAIALRQRQVMHGQLKRAMSHYWIAEQRLPRAAAELVQAGLLLYVPAHPPSAPVPLVVDAASPVGTEAEPALHLRIAGGQLIAEYPAWDKPLSLDMAALQADIERQGYQQNYTAAAPLRRKLAEEVRTGKIEPAKAGLHLYTAAKGLREGQARAAVETQMTVLAGAAMVLGQLPATLKEGLDLLQLAPLSTGGVKSGQSDLLPLSAPYSATLDLDPAAGTVSVQIEIPLTEEGSPGSSARQPDQLAASFWTVPAQLTFHLEQAPDGGVTLTQS